MGRVIELELEESLGQVMHAGAFLSKIFPSHPYPFFDSQVGWGWL